MRRQLVWLILTQWIDGLVPPPLVRGTDRRLYADSPLFPGGDDDSPTGTPASDDSAPLLGDAGEDSLLLDDDLDAELGLLDTKDDTEDVDEDEDEDRDASLEELLSMGQMSEQADSLEAEWARRSVLEEQAKEEKREERRRKKSQEVDMYEEQRGIGFLVDDPVCRAVVACVTTGDAADNATVAKLTEEMYKRVGDRVVVTHNPDPTPDPELPFFEVWIEGYRHYVLHSRNWYGDGNLTPKKMKRLIDTVEFEVSDEAGDIVGKYGPHRGAKRGNEDL